MKTDQILMQQLKVGDSRAEVHYHLEGARVVVDRILNVDHGTPIQCTTVGGSAFDVVAQQCAALIESESVKAA